MYARTFRKCTPVQDVAGDGDGVEAGGEKRLAALGLVFSTACLQRCQRNEWAMRIRREKCLGWFTFPVGTGRMAAWGEMAVPAEDLSSVAFEKCLITRRM